MLEEQLQLVTGQWADGPLSFEGRHYTVRDLEALPKPVQRPRPNLILGGRGGPRSLALAARYADEYNTFDKTPAECRELRRGLDEACRREGRETIPLSLMTALEGTPEDLMTILRELSDAGVERVMLQHLAHRDLDAVEMIGRRLVPALA